MTTSNAAVRVERAAERPRAVAAATGRPPFRWSDLGKTPLHDFPIRDEILHQYLPLSSEMEVLEVGPGSGATAFRLARSVQHLTLLDVAAPNIARLQAELNGIPNLAFVCADAGSPGLAARLGRQFDAAFALDVFEYVPDPAACLRNLAAALRPGGQLLISFPNTPPPVGDGVTYFDRAPQIERLLGDAGFAACQIFGARIRPGAAALYRVFHEWPLSLSRRSRGTGPDARPQTYEATWAFQHQGRLAHYKLPIHFYWEMLGRAMRAAGEVFATELLKGSITGRQLVIRART